MTDTADLVKELDALFARATPGPWVPARRRGSWDWVVVQQSPRMNYEICQMFHDGTDFNEIGEANTRLICMLKTSWPAIRAALESTQARADKLEAELAKAKRESVAEGMLDVVINTPDPVPIDPSQRRDERAQRAVDFIARLRRRAESAESSLAAAKERLATLRNEVLEEAATVACCQYGGYAPDTDHGIGYQRACSNVADAIRALKTAGKE